MPVRLTRQEPGGAGRPCNEGLALWWPAARDRAEKGAAPAFAVPFILGEVQSLELSNIAFVALETWARRLPGWAEGDAAPFHVEWLSDPGEPQPGSPP
jgi:hypothetical protein